ncbi:MAG: SpoIIE family protein phosphatase, partial [Pyrinomonadaceae bacterium]
MRAIPRLHILFGRRLSRKLRRWRRHLTVARVAFVVELLVLCGVLLFMLTGTRAEALDKLREHALLLTLVCLLALYGLLHLVVTRRIVRLIERRLSPAEYDEHRILFDFGQEARAATNLDQLYNSIVQRIRSALETENVSIFVRVETGDYVCRISVPQTGFDVSRRGEETEDKLMLARDAFVIKRLRHLESPLVVEPEEFETWTRALESAPRSVREARERELETLKQVNSSLLLPVKIKEQLIGIVSLGPRRRKQHKYSAKDKEMLMSMAGQLAFVIENSRLVERMVTEENLRRELALATEVQQGLLPSQPPESAHLQLAGFCQPARGVGGDYYDFISLGDSQMGLAIADVAGKGISAALVMSNVQAALRSQTMARDTASAQPKLSLSELVSNINKLLCGSTGNATYVTFFYAQFNELTRQLAYVNAGHNPPFLIRARHATAHYSTAAQSTHRAVTVTATGNGNGKNGSNGNNGYLKLSTGGPVIGFFDECRYE